MHPSAASRVFPFFVAIVVAGCHPADTKHPTTPPSVGGAPDPTGGTSGSGGVSTGGTSGAGGTSGTGGAGGTVATDGASTGGAGGAADARSADSAPYADGPTGPAPAMDYGGVGQEPIVKLDHSFEPVPPMVTMECPDDPTQGFTEYQDSFVVQRPYDLPAKDRFSYDKGIYTAWVLPNDKSHATWSGTKSRTETRFSDLKTGEHLFSADVMVEAGSENVCIQQFKGALGPLGTYLRVNGGTLHQLGGATVATGIYGKWFNLKVAWNIPTGTGRVWINNCQKTTVNGTKGSTWYFKFGTYTCDSAKCTAHFKNIHLYQKGSTDTFNVKSPIR
jgi:hypothetical protein